MAHVTMNSKEIMRYLAPLLRIQADVIGWVCQQKGKITLEVADELLEGSNKVRRAGNNCLCHVPPLGRTEAEVLIGILKRMEEKAHRPPGPKRRN